MKLRVVHGEFIKEVKGIEEGVFLMSALVEYDRANHLRYFPVQELQMFENEVWITWYIIDDGIRYNNPLEYIKKVD